MNLECFRVKPDSGLSQVPEKAKDSWVVLGCFGQAGSHAPIKNRSLAPMDHLSLAPIMDHLRPKQEDHLRP